MIEFSLDPPSGHSNSCLDVQFKLVVEGAQKIELEIFNDSSGQQLEILSVSEGYILHETQAICHLSRLSGYVNIFNKDKMNDEFEEYTSVIIRCKAVIEYKEKIETKELSVEFFNESKSLDANIIPFDLMIDNPELDIKNNVPLSMHIVCDSEAKFELAIRSTDAKNECTFEVVAKKGRTDFVLPSEVIFADLNYSTHWHKKYQVYWVKFEGIDYMKFMNRKYIPIPESRITLNSNKITPLPQERQGPLGDLSEDFILCNKYFVHTWKNYTSLGAQSQLTEVDSIKRRRFLHEIQDLPILGLGSEEPTKSNVTTGREMLHTEKIRKPEIDTRQRVLLNAYRNAFYKKQAKISGQNHQNQPVVVPHNVGSINLNQPRKGGCGCARKKNA